MRYRTIHSWGRESGGIPNTPALGRRLSDAYRAVFLGDPADEDQEIVLTDLAAFSGFFRAGHPGTHDLAFEAGMRAVFERIFGMVEFAPEHIVAMATADEIED